MDAIKYIIGNFGKFLRIFFKIRFPKTIYKSMSFKGIFSISLNKQKIIFTNFRDKTSVLCEILDYESYKNFDELFSKNNYHAIIIDDKKHTAVRVKELNGQKKIGDNILFIPSDKALDLNNL